MVKKTVNYFRKLRLRIRFGNRIQIASLPKTHILPKMYVSSNGSITVGDNLMAERNASLESYSDGVIRVGNNVFINSNVKIVSRKEIVIGDNTMIAPNVCIYDHDHDWHGGDVQNEFAADAVHIGNNVWIGANSVILRGTTIGDNSVIAAGTVVKGNVDAGCILYQKRENVYRQITL